jgi:hypothetical protein
MLSTRLWTKLLLEVQPSQRDHQQMSPIVFESDNRQLRSEIPVMKKAAGRLAANPVLARKFLIENGFMTPKSGKLTKRYGG